MARTTGSSGPRTAAALRQAAVRLFARDGFAAVSMRAIASEVGVQAGALYNHVGGKEALLKEVMVTHLEELLAAWRATPRPEDPAAALNVFTRFHIRHHLTRADEVFIAYMELRSLSPDSFAEVERLRDAYEAELSAILKAGARSGAMRVENAPIATRAIIAMLTGVTTWYREGGPLSADTIEDIYTTMVARSVGLKETACSTHP